MIDVMIENLNKVEDKELKSLASGKHEIPRGIVGVFKKIGIDTNPLPIKGDIYDVMNLQLASRIIKEVKNGWN